MVFHSLKGACLLLLTDSMWIKFDFMLGGSIVVATLSLALLASTSVSFTVTFSTTSVTLGISHVGYIIFTTILVSSDVNKWILFYYNVEWDRD